MPYHSNVGSLLRDIHERKILDCIRRGAPISRTEISRIEHMSKSTVTRIVDTLISDGFVLETGQLESKDSKRKPIALHLNANRFWCIGVNISRRSLHIVISNFAAELCYNQRLQLTENYDGEILLQTVTDTIHKAMEEMEIEKDHVLGAGIGVPGLVDNEKGIIVNYASESRITNFPLKERLEHTFAFPIHVDNDVNTLVLSEQLFNGDEDTSNCLFVNGWDGVGSSVIINGTLLRGATNSVGEIGHMIIEPNGRKCSCGKDGCVEAYCTAEALCESTCEAIRRGRKTSLNDCVNGHIKSITCADILRGYEQGDQLCTEQVQNVARYLSICLSNTINLLNPNTLIFAGEMVEYSDLFFQTVREYTNELLISPSDQSVTFIRRSINDKYYVYGSISLVYAAFFMNRM